MRRPVFAVVAVCAFAAVLIAFSPPLSHPTEAPPPVVAGAPVRTTSTTTAVSSGTAPPAATATPPLPTAVVRAAPELLTTALHATITAASHALDAASRDDRVLYAAGLRARDAGSYAYAVDAWRTVVGRGGPLAPVASLRMAQALVSAGRREEAATAFAATVARADLPAALVTAARSDAADNAAALNDTPAALELLHAIRDDEDASTYDRAAAAWQAAQLRRDAADPAWTDDAAAAIVLQPASSAAQRALDALDSLRTLVASTGGSAAVPPLTAAYVRYRAYANDDATTRYRAVVDEPSSDHDAAIAWFYLGALAERSDSPETALADYAKSVSADPAGSLADDARYWRARIYDERGDVGAAVAEYDRLVSDFPESAFAPDARMGAALLLALHGNAADALSRLDAIAHVAGADAAAAARWSEVFRAEYELPANPSVDPKAIDPTALPSLIDAHSAEPLPPAALTEEPILPRNDAAVDPWMRATFGPPPADPAAVLSDPDYVLGRLLVGVGETSVGRALLRGVVAGHRDNAYALLTLARTARDLDLPDIELNAATRLLSSLSTNQRLSTPRSVLALAYPAPYLADATTSARTAHLPTLLLLALVRQESAFDPSAGSIAGAVGLTQVTPGTGEQIAKALGATWTPAMLLDPSTSLEFGAYYLAAQLDAFDGNVFAALAAYNGGPGNAARWEASAPFSGADGYLLAVDYSETDAYLNRVLENYAWYRYIYAGTNAPSLR